MAAAILVGAGWVLDIAPLRSLFTPFADISFNGAVAFLLAAASILLLQSRTAFGRRISQVCALVLVLIGVLMLSQHAFGWDLGIDQLLWADHASESPYPGRISVLGASIFLLLGSALLLIDVRTPNGGWPAQWLALLAAGAAFVVILGFAYNAVSLYRFLPGGRPAALQGMVLFLLVVAAVLLARPDRGLLAQLQQADAAGFLMRRLLPAALLVPPVVGWIRLQGEQAGLYGTEVGLALFATANVTIFSLLIWWTASAVRQADAGRLAAEARTQGQLARLDLLNHITQAISERQDVQSVFQVVVRTLEDNLPVDFACIAMYEAATDTIRIESVGNRSEALATELAMPQRAQVPIDSNGLSRCMQGALVYEPDIRDSTFPFPQRLARGGLRALVFAPLRAESSVFGMLIAARRQEHSFASGDCEFLHQLAGHVALATRQSQLYEALQTAYQDLRSSQDSVVQQERLRALGQMASGIAHDINNALSPAALYTESVLERETGLSAAGREKLTIVQRALDDVANTIARMRQFYAQQEPQLILARVDLNQLVAHVIELTRARWRDQPQGRGIMIELRTELQDVPAIVMGAEGEIRDALTNLVFNAVDAMPQGGILTLRTRLVRAGQAGPLSERASVEISDTGGGMDAETQRRCLEPFFTTKGERGTGLGLAMVYGMVQRHGAELDLDSTVGVGTTVRILFPAAASGDTAATTTRMPALTRRLRLLVVDDDPLLIKSLSDTLGADGHSVTTADGGQAGIDAFLAARRNGEPFDLVITDLGMPYVDGRKVAAHIRAEDAATPIVLLTGWGQRLRSENDIPPHVDRVLAKPPRVRELRAVLAELTAGREPV